jgi:triacylglycerol lipase
MNDSLTRRRLLQIAAAAGASPLAACALGPSTTDMPPIVFVPGNGDSAAIWMTTIWRFESNGWPRDRLHAIDLPYPLARDDDTKLQAGRTSAAEHMAFLAAEVKKVRAGTGASKVALVGNSRGGYAIRNFIVNGSGAAQVSHVVLSGVPNHGVYADPARNPGSEFNGAGPFLTALNRAGSNGGEVTPGIAWMTIRSDHEDKYAQPDGAAFGAPGMATHVGYDGPALAGAENIVIAGIDHRETAFSAKAFAEMFRFIAGRPATTLAIVPEATVILDGTVSGLGLDNQRGDFATNLPLVGAKVEVYATRADTGERVGAAAHRKTIGADGRWGPFHADGATPYEFVIEASGYMTTHVYRSPFPRSSSVVSLHPERPPAGDQTGTSLIVLTRPRGYFGVPRDRITLDGTSPPAGIARGVPSVATVRLKLNEITGRPVVAQFNDERIVGRAWPLVENQIVVLELTS